MSHNKTTPDETTGEIHQNPVNTGKTTQTKVDTKDQQPLPKPQNQQMVECCLRTESCGDKRLESSQTSRPTETDEKGRDTVSGTSSTSSAISLSQPMPKTTSSEAKEYLPAKGHEEQKQITLKVLPQNIIIKPSIQDIPTVADLAKLSTDKVPILKCSPLNTAIIIRRDGSGPISNSTAAFVEEMVRKSGMKIVESQTRIILKSNNDTKDSKHYSNCKDKKQPPDTNSQIQVCPLKMSTKATSGQLASRLPVDSHRPRFILPAPHQPAPLRQNLSQSVPLPQPCVYHLSAVNLTSCNSSHTQSALQTQWVDNGQKTGTQQQIPRPTAQPKLASSTFIPRPVCTTMKPIIRAPGNDYIKVRLHEKSIGAQWIVLPRGFAPPIKSPPLRRKQPASRVVLKRLEGLEKQAKENTVLSAAEECHSFDIKSKNVMQTQEKSNPIHSSGQDGIYDCSSDVGKQRSDEPMDIDGDADAQCTTDKAGENSNKRTNVMEQETTGLTEKVVTMTDCMLKEDFEGNDEQKSTENMTHVKDHLSGPLASNQQEVDDVSTFASRAEASQIDNTDSYMSTTTNTSKNTSDLAAFITPKPKCYQKIFSPETVRNRQIIRTGALTQCTPTLTYASLSPRCKTTYTSRAAAGNRNDPEPGEISGPVIGEPYSSRDVSGSDDRNRAGQLDEAAAPSLDDYTGPVDMYVYLPEKAFKEGSVTFLSLRK